jgi:uncharacterized membrane protein
MSDPNEPPRPEGSDDAPTPPPPSGYGGPTPPPPPYGDAYGGAASGAGGYGAPPPADPYQQPGPGGKYSPTEAISFGWRHFTAGPWTLLVPTLVVGIAVIIVAFVVRAIVVGGMTDPSSSLGAVLVAAAISSAITSLVTQILSAGLYKGGAAVADGRGFALGDLFEGWDKVQVLVAAVIIALLTLVGTLLCYFPALIVAYFTQFTLLFIVDKHMSATEAISASFRLCVNNLGSTILFWLLALVTIIVGAILCLVGLLVAVPIVLVALAYTFRRLQGEPVAQPAPRVA